MLVEIFQHISPSDRREAQLVCHAFFDAAHHPRFHGDNRLQFNYCELATNVAPVSVFARSSRTFHTLVLSNFECDKPIDPFWQRMGETIEYLEFNGFCDFGIYLPQVLSRFTRLRTLKLDADFMFDTRHFECRLPQVERLILTFNACDDDVANLVEALPNLQHIELLVLSHCCFESLLQFILKHSAKIRALTFQVIFHLFRQRLSVWVLLDRR